MPRPPSDLTLNNPYGHLTALHIVQGEKISGKPVWLCRCVCGREKKVAAAGLVHGSTKSCGICGIVPRGGFTSQKMVYNATNSKKPISTKQAKAEIKTDPRLAKYQDKPSTPFRFRRKLTVEEIAIIEAKMCGGGRFNWL